MLLPFMFGKRHTVREGFSRLEARIMNRLQDHREGQTIEQLEAYVKEPQERILLVLEPLRKAGYVVKSASGVWRLVREESGQLAS
jgi:DNA-binding transcriptional ArsR family regulator